MEDNRFQNRLLSMLNFRLLFSENTVCCFQKAKSPNRFFQAENQSQKLLLQGAAAIWIWHQQCCLLQPRRGFILYANPSKCTYFSTFSSLPLRSALFSKPKKTCLLQRQRKWHEKKKHSQCISAINSIHNCPAVCTQRNRPVSSLSFSRWKLIPRFQRHGLLVTH